MNKQMPKSLVENIQELLAALKEQPELVKDLEQFLTVYERFKDTHTRHQEMQKNYDPYEPLEKVKW